MTFGERRKQQRKGDDGTGRSLVYFFFQVLLIYMHYYYPLCFCEAYRNLWVTGTSQNWICEFYLNRFCTSLALLSLYGRQNLEQSTDMEMVDYCLIFLKKGLVYAMQSNGPQAKCNRYWWNGSKTTWIIKIEQLVIAIEVEQVLALEDANIDKFTSGFWHGYNMHW